MITQEEFIVIHSLYEKGHSISEIARITKLNRRTVRRRLQEVDLKISRRKISKPSKLVLRPVLKWSTRKRIFEIIPA